MKTRRAMNICTGEIIEHYGTEKAFKRAAKLLSYYGSEWRAWYHSLGYSKRPCQVVFKAMKKMS